MTKISGYVRICRIAIAGLFLFVGEELGSEFRERLERRGRVSFRENITMRMDSMVITATTRQGRKYGYCFQNCPVKTSGKRSLGRARPPPMKELRLPPKEKTVQTSANPRARFVESVIWTTTIFTRPVLKLRRFPKQALITSPQNVRERPKHNMDIVDAAIPNNMTGFRPMRSESRLKGRIDMVDATLRNVANNPTKYPTFSVSPPMISSPLIS